MGGGRLEGARRRKCLRGWIQLVQEPAAVFLGEHARETPRLVLEGLDVHDFHEQNIAGLGVLDVEGPREVVDLGEVDVSDVVRRVVVADLAAGPGTVC